MLVALHVVVKLEVNVGTHQKPFKTNILIGCRNNKI